MPAFASIAETRRIGAPIVRLVRVALGRDPDPVQLESLAARSKAGATLSELAADLVASEEFVRLHGPGPLPDEAFIARIEAQARMHRPAAGATDRTALLRAAAGLGATRADLIATLAESVQARADIPLLPGLVPGAAPDDVAAYRLWMLEYEDQALAAAPQAALPGIMVLLGAGDATVEAALRTAESLRAQRHEGWQLWVMARLFSAWPREALARLAAADGRIRVVERPEAMSLEADLGHALAGSGLPLACMLEPGDTLAPQALGAVAAVFADAPEVQVVYTDEDVTGPEGRCHPRFKPDFSPDAMLAGNAVGQLAVYRAGLLGAGSDARTFHDVALHAVGTAGAAGVRHLPFVLCHRAAVPRDWPALADLAEPARDRWPRVRFPVPEPAPLVSVIMPTRDQAGLLAVAAAGVLDRTAYVPLELLVVDNGSTEPEALALLERLAADSRVRVLRRPGTFNFAALCNGAAAEAAGEILLLLNNDTEVIGGDWLEEMVSHALRPGVGAVGARLLYPDGTLQHGGILLGPDGAATHVGRGAGPDDAGYDGQLACVRELSAVTGACLAIPHAVWRQVGGMDERLAVTWNDIDLCLRVRHAGLRVVWTPHAVLRHHEGRTRGSEAEDPQRQARFRAERDLVWAAWGDALDRDPFLNPNLLATEAGPLVLTRPRLG